MRPLPLPPLACSDVFSTCLNAITEPAFRARLHAIGANIAATAADYDARANAATLNLMPRVTSVGSVTKEELIGLYSDHLSAPKGAARSVYDHLRNAAPNRRCPLCGIGTVAVLDHHLPKAKYPNLSIIPANLVPTCHFCNNTKRASYPKSAGEQTLHPYYDTRLLTTQWVKATLDPGPPPVVVYSASPPSSWSAVDQQRVKRHFKVCGLATTFTSNANDELMPLKARLSMLDACGGPSVVQNYLEEQAICYAARPNSWQFTMYQALMVDAWFVGGGFNSIS